MFNRDDKTRQDRQDGSTNFYLDATLSIPRHPYQTLQNAVRRARHLVDRTCPPPIPMCRRVSGRWLFPGSPQFRDKFIGRRSPYQFITSGYRQRDLQQGA
ncbi:hypothetical protein CH63R_05678 [Colletotrichum higginsianum IMI 349063]|uniref:Uncharacterized protein n=1 Tax=Colletotrichum higginsianum (strain IMI 349063) TaxID=759273 RepID=A0A1B7YD34_COLHI|nr:hypothetical protein CH63R_05678 [Colletotrichum higginsianum IMI 349063]OBR09986.1 hypothetical protein CH63R_05678 [Colletotrichum higginsianum IMI 349063]